jgi:hypothetical protein
MSSLHSACFEDSMAQSGVQRMDIDIAYYRHLLEGKPPPRESQSLIPGIVMPATMHSNSPYIETHILSERGQESLIARAWDPTYSSIESPTEYLTETYTNFLPAHVSIATFPTACSNQLADLEIDCTLPESRLPSNNLGISKSVPLDVGNVQDSRISGCNSNGNMWELDALGWDA